MILMEPTFQIDLDDNLKEIYDMANLETIHIINYYKGITNLKDGKITLLKTKSFFFIIKEPNY